MDSRRAEYEDYIHSPWWEEKRQQAFKHYGRHCNRCPATTNLHVHHRHYRTFKNEGMEDLEILCHDCHMDHHAIKKVIRPLEGHRKPPKQKKKRVLCNPAPGEWVYTGRQWHKPVSVSKKNIHMACEGFISKWIPSLRTGSPTDAKCKWCVLALEEGPSLDTELDREFFEITRGF